MPNGGQTCGGKGPNGGHSSGGSAPQNITTSNPNGGHPGPIPPQAAPNANRQDYVNTSLTSGSYSSGVRPVS